MNRFENVDVLAALEQLMRQNTAFYQSDFEIDKEIIGRAAASDKAEDKTLLWMSRPSGTHCFRESDVYLQGTRQHNTWKFYGEQTRDRVLAYAVELTGKVQGVIRGNLYELDYPQHFRHVAAEAGEIHGHGGGQRDALVGGPEDHVELDAAGVAGSQKRLRVELAEAVEQGTGVEEAGVEEVRRETAGLGLELAEAKDVGFQGKFDELFLNRLHDCFFKREKEVARPRGIVWHCTAKPRYP